MHISFSSQQRIGLTNLSYRFNDSSTKNVLNNNEKIEKHAGVNKKNMDKSLGGSLRKNNILENLMKQKENLMDSKSALMEKALKDGDNPSSVKEKLKDIDKQIEEIDKQMSKVQLEEQRKTLQTEDKDKDKNNKGKESNKISDEASTKDVKTGISKDEMNSMLSLSDSLSQAKVLSSHRTSMSGEARVLKCEIKIDEERGIDPINKKKHVAQLEENIENISGKISDNLKEVNNKNKDSIQSNTSKNDASKNKQNTDLATKSNLENEEKLVIKQQVAQNIKHYRDNLADNDKNNSEKVNSMA